MPARVIRGEINSSRSLSHVSLLADLTFRALIVAVDDYGRADGRPAMLRATLYPTRDEVTDEQLDGWLCELEREGCVRRYEVDGERYVWLTGWEKHRGSGRRALRSRFPAPPKDARESPEIREIREIREMPGNPSEKREARSGKREAGSGKREAGSGKRGEREGDALPHEPATTAGSDARQPRASPVRPKKAYRDSDAAWIAKLARACPHGACDPGIVRAWLATIRPAIDARGYSDIRRAATSWWARVRPDELAAARTKAMREGLIARPPLEVYVPPLSAAEGTAIIAAINRGEIPRSLES